jgi:hypothetical protein
LDLIQSRRIGGKTRKGLQKEKVLRDLNLDLRKGLRLTPALTAEADELKLDKPRALVAGVAGLDGKC